MIRMMTMTMTMMIMMVVGTSNCKRQEEYEKHEYVNKPQHRANKARSKANRHCLTVAT